MLTGTAALFYTAAFATARQSRQVILQLRDRLGRTRGKRPVEATAAWKKAGELSKKQIRPSTPGKLKKNPQRKVTRINVKRRRLNMIRMTQHKWLLGGGLSLPRGTTSFAGDSAIQKWIQIWLKMIHATRKLRQIATPTAS
jgi:hypothetical protein